jgi:hypothetical protein
MSQPTYLKGKSNTGCRFEHPLPAIKVNLHATGLLVTFEA